MAQRGHWLEQAERKLTWVAVGAAAGMVQEPDLGELLAALPHWLDEHSEP
jgi:hypothetical protein